MTSTVAVLAKGSSTAYVFPRGWAGNICVGDDINTQNSKIEASLTGSNPPDIDVSYVDGFSVPIICSSQGKPLSGCNIDLFDQDGLTCPSGGKPSLCTNPARDLPDGPAPEFFKACEGSAYTFPKDDGANVSELKDYFISCCIGTKCAAPARQPAVRAKT